MEEGLSVEKGKVKGGGRVKGGGKRRKGCVWKRGKVKGGKRDRFMMVGKRLKGKERVRQGEGVSMVKGGKRDVCCLRVEEGGMGMISIDSLIKAKQFKSMHKILNGKNDNWNSIGKWWLKKYDQINNTEYFVTTCSDFNGLQIYTLPIYYQHLL